jgi:cell division protease FtsH
MAGQDPGPPESWTDGNRPGGTPRAAGSDAAPAAPAAPPPKPASQT